MRPQGEAALQAAQGGSRGSQELGACLQQALQGDCLLEELGVWVKEEVLGERLEKGMASWPVVSSGADGGSIPRARWRDGRDRRADVRCSCGLEREVARLNPFLSFKEYFMLCFNISRNLQGTC